ncbi:MAG: saccharopine dehydrogenase family protein [Gemmatimonadota bacterium]
MRICVLGAGRVGHAIARDLARDEAFDVVVADVSESALARVAHAADVTTHHADLADPAMLGDAIADAELVVGAVPGPMGFQTLRRVLAAGKDVVDISFCEEDPFELDALARGKGCTALVDCGIAPGASNLILGHLDGVLDAIDRFECMVGGLPVERRWPWEYKAPFSPVDVIAEYTRPARIRREGRDVTLPALSELEQVDVPGLGTLEAFVTDGLRTLLRTMETPTMVEKTLRYPGHAERMRMLRESGFFDREPVRLRGGSSVRPLDLTARLLFPLWKLEEGEEDLTVMRIEVEGTADGRPTRHVLRLIDRYDRHAGITSMARTTGYTCTAMVRLVAEGRYDRAGISPPEYVGRRPDCYDFVMRELADRGVAFEETVERS